ncbi:hypothetical protein L3V77_21060 [Vibrio sp. DW001]|uniref:hypothetical protein n=1 Tax=Vibrio sp. DW001 TaxID=2912315 RepID=UPI0023B1E160|nr:hypothetical protein [Vibrio sp. DW001]WED29899.1 hypothetical protein L3V77_21060 [Vibrio sp. DW001]
MSLDVSSEISAVSEASSTVAHSSEWYSFDPSAQAIWLVPLTLVAVQFLLKLFVAEAPSLRQAWKSFIHSPTDVGFLALSFIATIIMGEPSSANGLLATMFTFVGLIVVSIVMTKVSPIGFTRSKMLTASALVIVNYVLVSTMLIISVSKLIGE